VICASDATLALAALRETPDIALIFTDIVMPGMDGVTLAEAAWGMRPGIPVVFASGYSDETISEQLPKGAMFLQKPYRIASVTRLIQAALVARRLPVA
jgi:DNA-binding NtrC family response regulator